MKLKLLLTIICLMVLLSACSGDPAPQSSASATPEAATATLPEPTLEAALPTPSGSSDPITTPPDATQPPVFDLTRTEDNPITDAQQIIEILEALERIQRAQPLPPGWYLRTENDLIHPENPEHTYYLYHVIDEKLNCDLAMDFLLSPDGNFLGMMVRNYGTSIWSVPFRSPTVRMEDDLSYTCNLSNPNLYWLSFYKTYSDTFSSQVQDRLAPGAEQWGDYSYSAWFESEDDHPLFVLQEDSDNMMLAYSTDPDTKVQTEMRSEVEKRTYLLDTGYMLSWQTTITLVNNKTKNRSSLIQMDYYKEKTELPPSVLAFLEESLLKYDELQLP